MILEVGGYFGACLSDACCYDGSHGGEDRQTMHLDRVLWVSWEIVQVQSAVLTGPDLSMARGLGPKYTIRLDATIKLLLLDLSITMLYQRKGLMDGGDRRSGRLIEASDEKRLAEQLADRRLSIWPLLANVR